MGGDLMNLVRTSDRFSFSTLNKTKKLCDVIAIPQPWLCEITGRKCTPIDRARDAERPANLQKRKKMEARKTDTRWRRGRRLEPAQLHRPVGTSLLLPCCSLLTGREVAERERAKWGESLMVRRWSSMPRCTWRFAIRSQSKYGNAL